MISSIYNEMLIIPEHFSVIKIFVITKKMFNQFLSGNHFGLITLSDAKFL